MSEFKWPPVLVYHFPQQRYFLFTQIRLQFHSWPINHSPGHWRQQTRQPATSALVSPVDKPALRTLVNPIDRPATSTLVIPIDWPAKGSFIGSIEDD